MVIYIYIYIVVINCVHINIYTHVYLLQLTYGPITCALRTSPIWPMLLPSWMLGHGHSWGTMGDPRGTGEPYSAEASWTGTTSAARQKCQAVGHLAGLGWSEKVLLLPFILCSNIHYPFKESL